MNLAIVIGNEYCVSIDSTVPGYLKCVSTSLENIFTRCSNLYNSIRYLSREYKIFFNKIYLSKELVCHDANSSSQRCIRYVILYTASKYQKL